jgi:hypothetical protein
VRERPVELDADPEAREHAVGADPATGHVLAHLRVRARQAVRGLDVPVVPALER